MITNQSRRVLIVVENLPVPLDRRVWLEATALHDAGYQVSIICPTGHGWTKSRETIDGIHIYRYFAPPEAYSGAKAYAAEYLISLWHWFRLSRIIWRERGFDVIQGCNPPDLVFLLALWYKIWGVEYIFDHHDVCPELFEAKFGKRGLLYNIMLIWERITFKVAKVSIATNESFRRIAIARGKMAPDDVFVVRSAPKINGFTPGAGNLAYRQGARTVLGYVGVIGQQEGMDLLVQAVEHLVRKLNHDDIHVVVVGFGPSLPELQADVHNRGLDTYFTFPGALYGDDLLAALNSVDIGVSPDPKNTMNDISTMNKVMEYMTLEKPVVQFDLAEGRESAGDSSLYAVANDPLDFAAKIASLIEFPERAAEMGKAGRLRVLENLSWEHSTHHLLAAYERMFRNRVTDTANRISVLTDSPDPSPGKGRRFFWQN